MSSEYEAHEAKSMPDLARRVEEVRGGGPPGASADQRAFQFDDWLRWGQSDDPQTRKQWAWLADKKRLDRDRWVLDLWRSFAKDSEARAETETEAPWSFYQRHFFGWFLGRFDVQAACAVFVSWGLAGWLHYLLGLAIVITAFWRLQGTVEPGPSFLAFGGLLAVLLAAGFAVKLAGLPLYAWLNSLIPRLGAAVGIGYLFLFSAPHLVQMLNASQRRPLHFWLGVAGLVLAALLYLMFHIYRRVEPSLEWPSLLRRSLSVLALAVAYSALELLVAAPILFSKPFLCTTCPAAGCAVNADFHRLALCAAIALNLGVILQLAWDEKPLTEPL